MSRKNTDELEIEQPESPESVEITRLLMRGYDNERIFDSVAPSDAFPEALVRQRRSGSKKHIKFNKKERERLLLLIKVLRSQYNKKQERNNMYDEALRMDAIVTMDQVKEVPTKRFSTGFVETDQVFGYSTTYDEQYNPISKEEGVPRGKISLIAGAKGVGKTMWYTANALNLIEAYDRKVLVFQKEQSLGEYKETVMNMYRSQGRYPTKLQNLIVRQDRNNSDQCRLIEQIRPDLVIFDSYNMTHNSETKAGIEDIVFFTKKAIGDHTACWMIAHLNERGTIKGNNHIQYLVDSTLIMRWSEKMEPEETGTTSSLKGRFCLYSDKNRQGPKGIKAFYRHVGHHITVIPQPAPVEEAVEEDDE